MKTAVSKTLATKTLKVKFGEIPQGGLEFHFSNESRELDEQFKDILGEKSTYSISARVDQLDPMTQLKGSLTALIPHICSRCAENFESKIDKKFTTLYYKSEDGLKTLSEGLNDLEGSFDIEFLPAHELDLGKPFMSNWPLKSPSSLCAAKNALASAANVASI